MSEMPSIPSDGSPNAVFAARAHAARRVETVQCVRRADGWCGDAFPFVPFVPFVVVTPSAESVTRGPKPMLRHRGGGGNSD